MWFIWRLFPQRCNVQSDSLESFFLQPKAMLCKCFPPIQYVSIKAIAARFAYWEITSESLFTWLYIYFVTSHVNKKNCPFAAATTFLFFFSIFFGKMKKQFQREADGKVYKHAFDGYIQDAKLMSSYRSQWNEWDRRNLKDYCLYFFTTITWNKPLIQYSDSTHRFSQMLPWCPPSLSDIFTSNAVT